MYGLEEEAPEEASDVDDTPPAEATADRRRQYKTRWQWQRRQRETPNEGDQRRWAGAERDRLRRVRESQEGAERRRRADAERNRRRHFQETPDEAEARRLEDASRHDDRRRRTSNQRSAASHGEALNFNDNFPPENDLGPMELICKHCSALHFKGMNLFQDIIIVDHPYLIIMYNANIN